MKVPAILEPALEALVSVDPADEDDAEGLVLFDVTGEEVWLKV